MILALAKNYLGMDGDARDPLASPLYADLTGLPPLLGGRMRPMPASPTPSRSSPSSPYRESLSSCPNKVSLPAPPLSVSFPSPAVPEGASAAVLLPLFWGVWVASVSSSRPLRHRLWRRTS